jgi:hypothetical protein
MRLEFTATAEQRVALAGRLGRFQYPPTVLELLQTSLPDGFVPAAVTCGVQSVHPDRFVVRAEVRATSGQTGSYALKVYSDDFGERVWAHAQALAQHDRSPRDSLCLPTRYIPHERTLVFPWVEGRTLSDVVTGGTTELLRRAAGMAADLHRLPIVPEPPTAPQQLLAATEARCDRLCSRWPEMAPIIEPLRSELAEACGCLDPADPAPVHGDLWAGQFVWTGDRLVLLDLDMFGYTDPAYDAGHFLAQMERCAVCAPIRPAHADHWLAAFRTAYLTAMPMVSARNIAFYRGLTLVRKIYTIRRTQPADWARIVPGLAVRAHAALEDVASAAGIA